MKNKNNLVCMCAFVLLFCAGCKNRGDKTVGYSKDFGNLTDTLRVVHVLHQPAGAYNSDRKYIQAVGLMPDTTYAVQLGLTLGPATSNACFRDPLLSSIEEGDTIVVANGSVIHNLTLERKKQEWWNGRQK